MLKDGKAVPFEAQALTEFLIAGDGVQSKVFKAITIVSKASGAGSNKLENKSTAPKLPAMQFGLR